MPGCNPESGCLARPRPPQPDPCPGHWPHTAHRQRQHYSDNVTKDMAGLQVGRKIYTINEDLLFLRPFSEVEAMINQAFCIRRSLRLLVATKAKEIIKIPDNPESLSFRLSGSEPPHVHAVRKGWEAAAAGLQPGQVILKVNGNNVNRSDYQEVLEHFSAQNTHQMSPQAVRIHK
ncbi:Phosphatidylinositol-3,4,5-trisphosphate-dependent Rac exchanger 1 protein [Crenichthys baileyi]|uniref:Phosphatidylinositol-3,4, 5-trisphosphate-dependent Rac exchanger 1 protein n=1 Tax=Crenichthys baileyi TaxID=28760 RepID=A0AAV9RXW6_9TELE